MHPLRALWGFAVVKPDGTVAASLTTDFHGTGDFGHALAIDAQGRIVAAGTTGDQFALMRASL